MIHGGLWIGAERGDMLPPRPMRSLTGGWRSAAPRPAEIVRSQRSRIVVFLAARGARDVRVFGSVARGKAARGVQQSSSIHGAPST
jgi:hypothetical protein